MRTLARPLNVALLLGICGLMAWTPRVNADIAARWATPAVGPVLLGFLALATVSCGAIDRTLRGRRDGVPYALALGLLLLCGTMLAASLWPAVVPPAVTIHDAAAPRSSLRFALVGALAILPLVLGYTAWAYRVFHGKVRAGGGYHHDGGEGPCDAP